VQFRHAGELWDGFPELVAGVLHAQGIGGRGEPTPSRAGGRGSQGGLVMPLGDAGSDRSSRRRRRVRSDRVWSAMR
jgi:hypothetical protein